MHEEFDDSGFQTYPINGYMIFKNKGSYKAGKEFNYQYHKGLDSMLTVINYGFYYKENIHKSVQLTLEFEKVNFTEQKLQIVRELKLLNNNQLFNIQDFLKQNDQEYSVMQFTFNRKIEYAFFKFLKLYFFLGTNMPKSEIKNRLLKNIPLDYNSEILSAAFLRSTITDYIEERKEIQLSLVNI
jgi:hypothetical protein